MDEAHETLKELRERHFLGGMIGHKIFADGMVAAKIGTIENDPEGRLINELAQAIDSAAPILHAVIENIKACLHPSANGIVKFLLISPIFDSDMEPILLAGLEDYLTGRYISAIHVLTPQVECCMRHLLSKLGEPSNKPSGMKYSGTTQAKNINELLEKDETINRFMADDVRLYLLAFLADRRGHNVRHRVAHALMCGASFSSSIADRVVHCLLLLSVIAHSEAFGDIEIDNFKSIKR